MVPTPGTTEARAGADSDTREDSAAPTGDAGAVETA